MTPSSWWSGARLWILLFATQAVIFVASLFLTRVRTPFWDMLDFIDHYLDRHDIAGWWNYAWLPDNEHHSLWSRLLTILDVEAFDGGGLAFLLFGVLALLGCAALLCRAFALASSPGRMVPGCLALSGLFLTVPAAVDCAVPMNGGYVHATFFLILSLFLLDYTQAAHHGARGIPWPAVLAAIAAGCGNAVGLLAWPVLILAAWRGGLGRRSCAWIAVSGAVFCAAYLAQAVGNPAIAALHSEAALTPARLLRMADYALTYAGLPWTRAGALAVPGRLAGAALLAAGLVALIRLGLSRHPLPRFVRICLGMILFSLGTMALAALGRVDQNATVSVPVRYAVLMAPLHAGLLGLLLCRPRGPVRICASVPALVAAALFVVSQAAALPAAQAGGAAITASVQRFLAGERDEAMQRTVYPNLDRAEQIFARMRHHRTHCWLSEGRFCGPGRG